MDQSAPPPANLVGQHEATLSSVLAASPELALQASRAYGAGLVLVRKGGRILDADSHVVRLVGRTVDQLRELDDVATLLPTQERSHRVVHRLLRRSGSLREAPTRSAVLHADGSVQPVDYLALAIPNSDLTLLVIRDASERSRLDQQIDWYGALCERMPVGVMIAHAIATPDGPRLRLLSANDAACSSLGMDLKQVLGKTLAEIFPGQANEEDRLRVFSVLRTGRTEQLSDVVIGDPVSPDEVYRRTVIGLSNEAVAMLIENVSPLVRDDLHRRALMERVVSLSDSERRRIAMGIHDEPLQQIAAATLLVGQGRRRGSGEIVEWLTEAESSLRESMDALRHLVFDLSPPELVESGLRTALGATADYLFAGTGTWVHVDCPGGIVASPVVCNTTFRIATEALTNVKRHATAASVRIVVQVDEETLRLDVADDGGGFVESDQPGHFGIGNMRDRAESLGGTCGVTTSPSGTTMTAILPLAGTTPPAQAELVSSLRELDLERLTVRRERDALRARLADADVGAAAARQNLTTMAGFSTALRLAGRDGRVAEIACKLLAARTADAAAVRVWNDSRTVLQVIASWHSIPTQLAFINEHFFVDRGSNSVVYMVATSGEPALIDRTKAGWQPIGQQPPEAPVPIHSALFLPIFSAGHIAGVLTLARDKTPEPLSVDDLGLCESLAAVIGAYLPHGQGRA